MTTLSAPEALERLRADYRRTLDDGARDFGFEFRIMAIMRRSFQSSVAPGWRYIIAEDRVERIEEDGSA